MHGSFEGGILPVIKFKKVEAGKFENKYVLVESIRYIAIDIWIRNYAPVYSSKILLERYMSILLDEISFA